MNVNLPLLRSTPQLHYRPNPPSQRASRSRTLRTSVQCSQKKKVFYPPVSISSTDQTSHHDTHLPQRFLKLFPYPPPLRHQRLPNLASLVPVDRKIFNVRNNPLEQFHRQAIEGFDGSDRVGPPGTLLGWHVGGGEDADGGVDEEEGEDFAVAWFCWMGRWRD